MSFRFSRDWDGETVFIIGGGPSVLEQNIERLEGRKVLAVKSSYLAAPFAQYVLFSDDRWWKDHSNLKFGGRVVYVGDRLKDERLLKVRSRKPPGLSPDNGTLTVLWTIVTAAIDAAVFLGARRIVLLGVDHKKAADGRCHHHPPHKWAWQGYKSFDNQRKDLATMVAPLKAKGIEVINCSPGSALSLWPVMPLTEVL